MKALDCAIGYALHWLVVAFIDCLIGIDVVEIWRDDDTEEFTSLTFKVPSYLRRIF